MSTLEETDMNHPLMKIHLERLGLDPEWPTRWEGTELFVTWDGVEYQIPTVSAEPEMVFTQGPEDPRSNGVAYVVPVANGFWLED